MQSPLTGMSAEIQAGLNRLNEARLTPGTDHPLTLAEEIELREVERQWLESECAAITARAAAAPTESDQFMAWFEGLRESGPGQNDRLFRWLAEEASVENMTWFLAQEVAGEAGFDDLVALTQLKLPVRAKLEMARNYWDEMGRGRESGMHGPMLDRLVEDLGIPTKNLPVTWEAVAIGNLMMALAANRVHAYRSVGALGVIELTAPSRAVRVTEGLERLGVATKSRRYYALHATLDVKHSHEWNEEVIRPLVHEKPERARQIAEGALMRLNAGARCFERYRRELGVR
jgi:hypothetical protein